MTSFLIPPLIYFNLTSNLSARTVNSASKICLYLTISLHLSAIAWRQERSISSLHYCNPLPPSSPAFPLTPHKLGQWPRGMLNKWISNNITSLLKISHSRTAQPHMINHISLTHLVRPGPCPPHRCSLLPLHSIHYEPVSTESVSSIFWIMERNYETESSNKALSQNASEIHIIHTSVMSSTSDTYTNTQNTSYVGSLNFAIV